MKQYYTDKVKTERLPREVFGEIIEKRIPYSINNNYVTLKGKYSFRITIERNSILWEVCKVKYVEYLKPLYEQKFKHEDDWFEKLTK